MNAYRELRLDVFSDLQQDNLGIWEVGWRANTLFPDLTDADRTEVTAKVIGDLLSSGEASLVDANDRPMSDPSQIDWASKLLQDPPDTRYWLRLTARGEAAYEAEYEGRK